MTSLVLSAIAAVLFALWVALTLWDKRTQRRLQAAQRESERRWPMLAVEDFTEEDELVPARCPGPLVWYDSTNGAILLCASCGYIVTTGGFQDEAHAETSVMREGLAS